MTSQVFNQDCISYMRSLPDKYFHLSIADPPYGAGGVANDGERFGGRFKQYNTGSTDMNTWDAAPPEEFFAELTRVSQHQIIWGANFFNSMPGCKCFLVWVKTNIPDGFQMAQAEYAWTTLTCNSRVYHGSSARSRDGQHHFHPTEKPAALYKWAFEVWLSTLPQPLEAPLRVFDPMMGSQSSRIAARVLELDYYGCEIDAEYYRRGCQRYDEETEGLIARPHGLAPVRQLTLF